jgi:predicted kinase
MRRLSSTGGTPRLRFVPSGRLMGRFSHVDNVTRVELVLLIGIPATGKTSFYASEFLRSHLRISRDTLGTKYREAALFNEALRTQARVVVDDTNVTRADRARFIVPAKEAGYAVRGYFFESRREDARARNAVRDERDRVPEVAIRDKSSRLELPCLGEGFDELFFVRLDGDRGFVTEEWRDEV